ncbi:MAG: MopE-related protein, partial [Myxococcota bacterium]
MYQRHRRFAIAFLAMGVLSCGRPGPSQSPTGADMGEGLPGMDMPNGAVEVTCDDALDDDADGLIDCGDPDCAGASCAQGAVCDAGQCSGGEQGVSCGDGRDGDRDGLIDCEDPDCVDSCACTPGDCEDACDNDVDDDADGVVNEGCACMFRMQSEGVCLDGVLTSSGVCGAPIGFQDVELSCDGLDNDCDGITDEGCPCVFMESSVGVCALAVRDEAAGACAEPRNYQAEETVCDGLDNDCDGDVDEGCVRCDYRASSVGVCAFGQPASSAAECLAPVTFEPDERSCDGADNDCDGVPDEGCPCAFNGLDRGVCRNAVRGAADGMCAPPFRYMEEEQGACDGVDNDCDGATDEGCQSCFVDASGDGVVEPFGVCRFGLFFPQLGVCAPPPAFEPEETVCDGLDNDCDGQTDELCTAREACVNGLDDDADGLVDCDDDDCQGQGRCGRVIFVTSQAYFPDEVVGTLEADNLCQLDARASGLGGQWRAVLSSSTAAASARVVGSGPLFNREPTPSLVYPDLGALFDPASTPESPLGYTASGVGRAVFVWTGARSDGSASPSASSACSDWSAAAGQGIAGEVSPSVVLGAGRHLEAGSLRSCAETASLLCVSGLASETCGNMLDDDGDGLTDEIDPHCGGPGAVGRERCVSGADEDRDGRTDCADPECATAPSCGHLMFALAEQSLLQLRGTASLDNACQLAANAQGLGGAFTAVVTRGALGARARVSLRGPIFGPRGRFISSQDAFFSSTEAVRALPVRDAAGDLLAPAQRAPVATGSSRDGFATGDTCADFTADGSAGRIASGSLDQRARAPVSPGQHLFDSTFASCDQPATILCIHGQVAEDCATPGDQDGDFMPDVADPHCGGDGVEQCDNGVDDDGDGAIDCDDPDCPRDVECGQITFVTDASFDGDLGGPPAADNVCQLEALAAGRVGQYAAVLSGSAQGALERAPQLGPVYAPTSQTTADVVISTLDFYDDLLMPLRADADAARAAGALG